MSLQDCCSDFSYGLNAPAKAYDGVNKYIRITDIDENTSVYKSDAPVSPDGLLSDEYLVNENDILFARTGASTGKTYLYNQNDGRLFYAGFLIKANVNNNCDPYFIFSQTKTQSYRRWVEIMSTRSGQPGINSQEYASYPLYVPSKEEQEKIALLLRGLDKRILVQIKIIEELTTLRSALYDSMFCSPGQEMPKFRIQSFSGKWQLCQLNEICSRKYIKNKDNLYSRVLTIAAQHGLVDQESFFKKRIASENLESYLCLDKGDFAYNKSYSSDYPWGAVKRLSNFDKGIISPLYICFTPKPEVVDPDYLAHYFESTKWHSGISEISGEGARNHGLLNMSVIDYFNTCHRIPGLDEQKAIARRLNAIAHKLQTEQEYLELLNRQKDCFLKQMFI